MRRRMTVAVVGGGITGLTAALTVSRRGGDAVRVVLIEAEVRLGGKIRTEQLEGRPLDMGPDGFATRFPGARDLCKEVGLEGALVEPAPGGAFLWSRGRLHRLPRGLMLGVPTDLASIIRSGILSPLGLLRAGMDIVLPGGGPGRDLASGQDVSVGSLARRRFGREVLSRLVDPLVAGVYAGRSDGLSLRATAPHLDALARAHRSLLLGSRAALRGTPAPAGGPSFLTVSGGLDRLVEAVRRELGGVDLLMGRPVTRLAGSADGSFLLWLEDEVVGTDAVILALPAFAAGALVKDVCPEAAAILNGIRYASVATVGLVYPPGALPPLPPGSGFLVSPEEGGTIVACTWASAKWSHLAAPDGAMTVRCSVGRADDETRLSLDDDELVDRVAAELAEAVGFRGQPRAWQVQRWPRALPQYEPGHLERVARIESALPDGVVVAGAAYRGVGLADCVRQGAEAAERVLRLGRRLGPAGDRSTR